MNQLCNSHTRLYCILGNPVQHCYSPIIHNLAFTKKQINSVFLSFVCDHHNIQPIFQSIRALGIQGGAITMPVKIEAMQFMDTIADDARLIRSINVFKNENGVLAGFNTDGLGMVRFLQSQSISFYSKVILAGAGGAGQSIAVQLALHGTKSLAIYDKNILAASSLAERISQNIPACTAYAIPFDEQTIIRELQDSALFIDATPLGMPPFENQSPIKSFDGIP